MLLAVLICGSLLSACGSKEEPEEEEQLSQLSTITYDAGEFVTNIRDSKKMLSCAIKIDLISERLSTTLAEKDYVAKDTIVRELRQLTENDLDSSNVEANLSESLVEALNQSMNTQGFYKVYFVKFVYQ